MKCTFPLVAAMLLGTTLFAQSPISGKVSGKILEKADKPLSFATVLLLKSADSTLVKGAIASETGNYEIENIGAGRYIISATMMGFQKVYSKPFDLTAAKPTHEVPTLTATEIAKTLGEVQIVAQKPFIEQQIDKMVVNVENSIVAAGSSALEVLERAPGVSVDKDGNISLKGKQAVRVMIDGKPTYLSNQDLANLLRNMQSGQLDKIEIMTNPSAKYDAEGNAGIINIKTKKNQNWGTNGSFSVGLGYGRFEKENVGLNLNHRNGKWNMFGNYSANNRGNFNEQDITRKFFKPGTKELEAFFDQHGYRPSNNRGHNLKVGADYFLSPKTTIGVLATGSMGVRRETGDNTSDFSNGLMVLQSTTVTSQSIKNNWQNLTGNVNLKHTFDSTGRELTMDVDYAHYTNLSDQTYRNRTTNPAGVVQGIPYDLLGDTRSDINIYSAKTDYTMPLSKRAKLEMGLKTSWVISENDMKFYNRTNEVKVPDLGRTNDFVYRENVNAAYLNFSTKIKKTSLQLGLRAEHTNARGHQKANDSTFTRDYVNLFPSVFVQHELNKNNTLGASYSYRIDRPDYEDLNPFLYFLDPYTFQKGNPYLQPQFTHATELSHTFMGAFTTTLNYSRTNGVMADALQQDDAARTTFVTKQNFGFRENYGIAISAPIPIRKWWTMINYVNLAHNRYVGQLSGATFDQSLNSIMFNIQNQFKVSSTWSAEVSGFYQNGFLEGTIIGRPMGQISLGAQKQLWNRKATLKFSVRDVFWQQQFRGFMQYQNIDLTVVSRWESRVANVTFSYRFGNNKVTAARQRQTGLESEAGRVKNQ